MKVNEKLIEKLRLETGADYGFCEKVLKKFDNDYDKSKIYIITYNDKFLNRFYRNISSVFTGDRSFRLRINDDNGDNIFDIPLIIPTIALILLPVSSIIIGMFLILLVLLNSSMHIETAREKRSVIDKDVDKQEKSVEDFLNVADAQYEFNKEGNTFVASKQNIEHAVDNNLNLTSNKDKPIMTGNLANDAIITKTDDGHYLLTIK